MLFSDALFLPFLLTVFFAWLPFGRNGRKAVLLLASLIFYASWDVRFPIVLSLVWIIVFIVPRLWARETGPASRRRWLVAGVAALLVLLFVFKYLHFFLEATRPLWRQIVTLRSTDSLKIILPVGISFYTLQAIGYLVDSYRGRVKASRSPLDTALYVSFFPLLFAGPIEKGSRWLPQLAAYQPFRLENLRDGLERMLLGYVLKIGIADPIAPFCQDIFARTASAGSGELWAGAFGYALQILADFAGYSLIARGVSKLFGYEVINNFEQPYFSRSFSEFWRRWHISLSNWIWEYVFHPIMSFSLRRISRFRNMTAKAEMRIAYPCAVMTTMGLCGLWHGAGWTYVLWGVLHGFFLSFERLVIFGNRAISKHRRPEGPKAVMKALISAAVVFLLVMLAWVVFRSTTLHEAAIYLSRMFTAGGWIIRKKMLMTLAISFFGAFLINLVEYRRQDEWFFRSAGRWRGFAYAAAVAFMVLFGSPGGKIPFIYFQF
jgi:alginate O-acetyltransferase complex protein AlgI